MKRKFLLHLQDMEIVKVMGNGFIKISLATEERLSTVRTAIQKKLNENEKKQKRETTNKDNTADLLEGWTILGGDKATRNKTVQFDAELLDISTDSAPSLNDSSALVPTTPPPPPPPPPQSDTNDDIALSTPPKVGIDPQEVTTSTSSSSESDEDITPRSSIDVSTSTTVIRASQRKSDISEETVGWFGILTNAIIWNVLSLVDAYDLCQLSRTSSHFYKLATNEFLWERLYIKVFRRNNMKVDKDLWQEQQRFGGYRSLYGTRLCEDQIARTLRSLQNTDHNAIEWICKPLVSMQVLLNSPDVKVLMFGLDGVGKTTILYKLYKGERVKTEHTIGFNTEVVEHKGFNLQIWDLEHKPQNSFEFWKTYFAGAQGIIFVVDGTKRHQLPIAKATLDTFLADPHLSQLPLLVYVNKRDMMDSMSILQVLVALNLHNLCNKGGWHILPFSVIETEKKILEEGLNWLVTRLSELEVQKTKSKLVS